MGKRGQLSSFIIIGMLFVAAFAFLYFINYLQAGGAEPLFSLGLTSEVGALKANIGACLMQTTRQGLDYFGVKESSQGLIESYIEAELEDCIDYKPFEEKHGLDIDSGAVDANVVVTEQSVLVDLNYPITITKKGTTTSLNKFNYYIKREKIAQLSFDANHETTQQRTILTEDKDAELIIPTGTKVTDEDGNTISEVSLKVLDRNFDGLNNDVVIGMVAYEGLPDGARFEPPITLIIKYNPNDVPPGIPEDSLRIAWFDKTTGIWKSLPSTVNTKLHTITAQISHFTPVAILARCSKYETPGLHTVQTSEQIIGGENGELVFEQTCGKSVQNGDGWTDGGSCLDATWEPNSNNFHESDELGYTQKITSINPGPSGQITAECVKEDWDGDDANSDGIKDGTECPEGQTQNCNEAATPQTFGYEENHYSAGYGYITFKVEGSGDSCIATDEKGNAEITYEVRCSTGDICFDEEDNPTGLFRLHDPEETLDRKTIEDNWGKWKEESQIQAGLNDFWLKIENKNNDGCAWATAKLTIIGTGITWYPKLGLTSECTIQERINFLCRLGDPDYPSCSKAFMDERYSAELNWLVKERKAYYGDPAYEGDKLLRDTNYETEAPKADAPPGCGRGFSPSTSCCCDTANKEQQNSEHCMIVEGDCKTKAPSTHKIPAHTMSACEGEEEKKACTTSDGMTIKHGQPYVDGGKCVLCQDGTPVGVVEEWCAGVKGCCEIGSNICEDGVLFPDCDGVLHTGMYCKDVKGCPQSVVCSDYNYDTCEVEGACRCEWYEDQINGICIPIEGSPEGKPCEAFGKIGKCDKDGKCIIDPCEGKEDGYYCYDEKQFFSCKDGKMPKDHPMPCPGDQLCKGEGPAPSSQQLCKKGPECPEGYSPSRQDCPNPNPHCGNWPLSHQISFVCHNGRECKRDCGAAGETCASGIGKCVPSIEIKCPSDYPDLRTMRTCSGRGTGDTWCDPPNEYKCVNSERNIVCSKFCGLNVGCDASRKHCAS